MAENGYPTEQSERDPLPFAMEGMRPRSVHCVARSTPPHVVLNVMANVVQSALTHTLVAAQLFIWRHGTCHMC